MSLAGMDMSSLAAMFGGGGGGGLGGGGLGGVAGGVPPVADPETAYASQLTQLQVSIGCQTVVRTMDVFITPLPLAECTLSYDALTAVAYGLASVLVLYVPGLLTARAVFCKLFQTFQCMQLDPAC